MFDKIIHIEKYEFSSVEKEEKPYTVVPSDLIQKFPMNRSGEFLLWLYLESLPPTWIPNKHHIMKHFDISARTYERYMSYLNATNLVEYRQNRTPSGSFGQWTLIVLNGMRFNPDAVSNRTAKIDGAVVNRVKTEKVIHNLDDHRSAKNGGTVKMPSPPTATGTSPFRQKTVERCNDAHINNIIINKINNNKTNKGLCSVFVDSCSVKSQIQNLADDRSLVIDDETANQGVFYCYTSNSDKSPDSVNKRINIFLKLIRERKWSIPTGYAKDDKNNQEKPRASELLEETEQARIQRQWFTNELQMEKENPCYVSITLRDYPEARERYKKYVK